MRAAQRLALDWSGSRGVKNRGGIDSKSALMIYFQKRINYELYLILIKNEKSATWPSMTCAYGFVANFRWRQVRKVTLREALDRFHDRWISAKIRNNIIHSHF